MAKRAERWGDRSKDPDVGDQGQATTSFLKMYVQTHGNWDTDWAAVKGGRSRVTWGCTHVLANDHREVLGAERILDYLGLNILETDLA